MITFVVLFVVSVCANEYIGRDVNERWYHNTWRKWVAPRYNPNSWTPPIWDTTCTFNRDMVHYALAKYVDVAPKDNVITQQEIETALDRYLPWYLKPVVWVGSTDSILDACGTGTTPNVITPKSFKEHPATCLPFKKNWCTVQWFYDNIENGHLRK